MSEYGRVGQFDHEADEDFANNSTTDAAAAAASNNEQPLIDLMQSAVGHPVGETLQEPSSISMIPPESQEHYAPAPGHGYDAGVGVFGTIGSEAARFGPNSSSNTVGSYTVGSNTVGSNTVDRSTRTLEAIQIPMLQSAPVSSGQPATDLLDTSTTRTAPSATMAAFDPMNAAPVPITTEATAFDPNITSNTSTSIPSQEAPSSLHLGASASIPEASTSDTTSTAMEANEYERPEEEHELEFFEDENNSLNDSSRDESRRFVRNLLTGEDDDDDEQSFDHQRLFRPSSHKGKSKGDTEMGAFGTTSLSTTMGAHTSFNRSLTMEEYDLDLKHHEMGLENQRKSKRNKIIGIVALLLTIVIAIVVGSTSGGGDTNKAPSANSGPSGSNNGASSQDKPTVVPSSGGVNGTNATLPPGVTLPPFAGNGTGGDLANKGGTGGGGTNKGKQETPAPSSAFVPQPVAAPTGGSGPSSAPVAPPVVAPPTDVGSAPSLAPVAPVAAPTVRGGGGTDAPTMAPITPEQQERLDSVVVAAEQYLQGSIDWNADDTPIALKNALAWMANGDPSAVDTSDPKFPQRLALAAMYFATNPGQDRWISYGNWISSESQCSWYGVSCDAAGDVVEVNLSGNGLKGHLPSELVLLTALTKLNLSANNVFATIPTTLGRLSSLKILDLGNNLMVGSIPTEAYQATQLQELHLNNNMLTGTLSADLARWTKLEQLNLQSNQFRGTVPDVFGSLASLTTVRLDGNQFTGNVPSL